MIKLNGKYALSVVLFSALVAVLSSNSDVSMSGGSTDRRSSDEEIVDVSETSFCDSYESVTVNENKLPLLKAGISEQIYSTIKFSERDFTGIKSDVLVKSTEIPDAEDESSETSSSNEDSTESSPELIEVECELSLYDIWMESIDSNENETYIDKEYVKYAIEIGEQYDVSPELIVAMIETESDGIPTAKSGAQCVGLMQVSPKWNKDRANSLGVTDFYDPYSNIRIGTDFLAELFGKYNDIYTVLMCYNEGEYGTAIERASNGRYSKYATTIVQRTEELKGFH